MPMDDNELCEIDSDVLRWLTRTYVTHDEWKAKAREIYNRSNGDSDLSRQRLAWIVRDYFVSQSLSAEEVERWSGNVLTKVRVVPPKVGQSNAGYFDWLFVADYLLLSCASPVEQYQEENQQRETEYQQLLGSYNLRVQVAHARQLIRQNPDDDEQMILAKAQETYPKVSLANVKEAIRREARGEKGTALIEPKRAADLPLYKSIYF